MCVSASWSDRYPCWLVCVCNTTDRTEHLQEARHKHFIRPSELYSARQLSHSVSVRWVACGGSCLTSARQWSDASCPNTGVWTTIGAWLASLYISYGHGPCVFAILNDISMKTLTFMLVLCVIYDSLPSKSFRIKPYRGTKPFRFTWPNFTKTKKEFDRESAITLDKAIFRIKPFRFKCTPL